MVGVWWWWSLPASAWNLIGVKKVRAGWLFFFFLLEKMEKKKLTKREVDVGHRWEEVL